MSINITSSVSVQWCIKYGAEHLTERKGECCDRLRRFHHITGRRVNHIEELRQPLRTSPARVLEHPESTLASISFEVSELLIDLQSIIHICTVRVVDAKDLLRYGWRISGGAGGSGTERLEQTERAVRELAAPLKRIGAHRLMHLVPDAFLKNQLQ